MISGWIQVATTATVMPVTPAVTPRRAVFGSFIQYSAKMIGARHDVRADDGDRRDGIGKRHQRRVQQPGYPADHAEPDERRQHEDEQHRSKVGGGHDFRTSPAWVTQVSRMI